MDRSKIFIILFAAVAAVCIFEMVELFMLRFEYGDVYPPYSSYRSDPIGVRALYGAMGSLDRVSVKRNIQPISSLEHGRDSTLLFCGSNTSKDPEDVIEALEGLVAEGARLVIAYYPLSKKPVSWLYMDEEEDEEEETEKERMSGGGDASGGDKPVEEEDDEEKECDKCRSAPWYTGFVSIEDRWGFSYAYSKWPEGSEDEFFQGIAEKRSGPEGLPRSLSWHTALYFDELDQDWRPLYYCDGHPVIIKRTWGRGSIVLSSDSYFFSNQAMQEERHPGLLAWIIGPSSTVVFDEAHLGVYERQGVMTLIRGYRLTGVIVALLLVAALFVWKNALSLVPRQESGSMGGTGVSGGRDSAAGLVNLLRRSISPRDLISVCVEEWQGSLVRGDKTINRKKARIKAIAARERSLPIRQRDPAAAYKAIHSILKERD